ncbi:MAG: orotate phosphoribosyltransferase [Nitrospirae bacterium CG_4_9_14_3_um_filter_53_35]|nr:MAG: orotate phosphoribosyltransferase [Nitrospirae bacterium CG2_30_53_67]PIS38370.1 MAG: orotate phosphoribosyltransferase [Nitrospirae bacterium CG08_land_8_20_14_0_20_52_24]PIV82637.1 MAG: orotate phosphoribosyltransferase [Nitrospirae bacterium CG17_big_fil_post_rev_8_21_14_2_50_50_9]PIW84331.1 MAG: orotate phosphoribosyltransferase [Nitrospirae bacterium CG_4_8_14_3_um_filter_50_41]PIX86018.1 MAG: orotate phosphoribosyltransferase [Nitrospirae bacterium CG_4_10_14_3_um_filter_53_41]PJ
MDARQQLKEIIQKKALQIGRFTLAHGGESAYYIDAKQVINTPETGSLIGELIYGMIGDKHIDYIGGLMYGAIPIAFSVSHYAFYQQRKNIPVVSVRKEAKKHGTQKYIEGIIEKGGRIVVVEDVVSTGKSVLTAIERLKEAGLKIAMVISIVDRNMGGRESLRNYDYHPIFSIDELLTAS